VYSRLDSDGDHVGSGWVMLGRLLCVYVAVHFVVDVVITCGYSVNDDIYNKNITKYSK